MKMTPQKVAGLLLAVFFAGLVRSQSMNHYRYVLVPERFSFQKEDNQYGLNMLTKALLEGVGFTAFMTGETLPPEVAANKCGALKADVVEKKKFLTTVLILQLKDCQGTVVYASGEGKSREKEWEAAYSEALRNVFVSVNAANYKYDSTAALQVTPAVVNTAAPAPVAPATPAAVSENRNILYAQPNTNGFQLIDTTPKKVMTLLKTSQQDSFIADDGVMKGIVFRKNGEWFFEYYKEDKLISQKLTIKF